MGVETTTYTTTNNPSLFSTLTDALAAGKAITAASYYSIPDGVPIVSSHAYTVVSTSIVSGTQYITVRNPWGFDGINSDSNPDDGFVTVTVDQFVAGFVCGSITV